MTHSTFTASEYAARVAAVGGAMQERGLDALLVTSPENVFYLTGLNHQGHFAFTALLLKAEGDFLLVARAMERHTLAAQVPGCEHVLFGDREDPAEAVARAVDAGGLERGRIGVEKDRMSFPIRVWEDVVALIPQAKWEDEAGIVDGVRIVKSAAEIDCIRQAAAVSDRAMQSGIRAAGVGANEREVAAEVYRSMVASGGEYPGLAPLIRTGDRLLQEHITWQDRTLRAGDALFMELSGCANRYHAPLTRMVYVGRAPEGADAAAEIVIAGLEATRGALKPGALTGEVYAAWKAVVDEALGHHDYHRHHCGYVTGIGFPPSWSGAGVPVGIRPGGEIKIRPGMVFHLLPWLLGQGPTDYAVSDTVLVTETGAELLTSVARTPTVVS
ncbi:MAG: aminopeptidase P family protein [Rubrobacteraceae bacterium]|nr:aminopeptidase P family protein [Rubrobacteraceae bacterium]